MAEGDPVGVVGLGNIGSRVARHLAETGLDVVGFDAEPNQAARSGVHVADGLGPLVERVSAVVLSLPGPPQIAQVVAGDGGLVEVCQAGQVVIDLSTTDPASSRSHAEALASRGVDFVDAGISGGPWAAETGELTLMVGAAPHVFAAHRWLLERVGTSIHHMGAVGAGHTMKLINNFLNGASLASAAEAMVMAGEAGLDLRQALDVINQSSGRTWATEHRFPRILEGDFLEGGLSSRLMAKDLVLYLQLASGLRAPSLTGPASLAAFRVAESLGYGAVVSNHVVDALSELSNGRPFHDAFPVRDGRGEEAGDPSPRG